MTEDSFHSLHNWHVLQATLQAQGAIINTHGDSQKMGHVAGAGPGEGASEPGHQLAAVTIFQSPTPSMLSMDASAVSVSLLAASHSPMNPFCIAFSNSWMLGKMTSLPPLQLVGKEEQKAEPEHGWRCS